MPLPDLLDELRLGLRQGNLKANEWQTRYVFPETGEFIVSYLCVAFVRDRIVEAS